MMKLTMVPTFDTPTPLDDAADVLFSVPAGVPVELRAGPGGTTLVVRVVTTDAAGQLPTRAVLEQQNREALALVSAGSGAKR